MERFICLHVADKDRSKEVWLNADAIIAVMDMRPRYNWTVVDTYTGAGGYCVEETARSVIGLIKQQINPLDNYVCPVPVPGSWGKVGPEEEEE